MWHGDPAHGQAGREEEGTHLPQLPADIQAGAPHRGCSVRCMDINLICTVPRVWRRDEGRRRSDGNSWLFVIAMKTEGKEENTLNGKQVSDQGEQSPASTI